MLRRNRKSLVGRFDPSVESVNQNNSIRWWVFRDHQDVVVAPGPHARRSAAGKATEAIGFEPLVFQVWFCGHVVLDLFSCECRGAPLGVPANHKCEALAGTGTQRQRQPATNEFESELRQNVFPKLTSDLLGHPYYLTIF